MLLPVPDCVCPPPPQPESAIDAAVIAARVRASFLTGLSDLNDLGDVGEIGEDMVRPPYFRAWGREG
ncbi:hypothetical protein GCM10010306_071750 [Streptomyces umbrinus]|nr:hypothetical protein GCM10010306_071750 [Streptomyces umbrinus]GHH51257.1 hypothetical protein GCM10018775_49750 [Streptomyces umbrinus]